MKFFNTAGPVNQEEHYKLDPLSRFNMEEIMLLISQKKYFILHAPRQTGKTSSLLALRDYLNKNGHYLSIYINVEGAQAARNDIKGATTALIHELARRAENEQLLEVLKGSNEHDVLNAALTMLCEHSEKPVVLLIDEIDALVGDTLISVLRQIRSGYDKRPDKFPVSMVLCGLRDIQDYRLFRDEAAVITGGSPFNIKAESLRLGDFSKEEVKTLLLEHTKETGQQFEETVFDYIFDMTSGQPWLVNAIAYELTYKMKENRDRKVLLTREMAEVAVNSIVVSRSTHLHQLARKLAEERVRNIILPIINNLDAQTNPDDEEYCIDLGLIKMTSRGLAVANKIYAEVIPRELTKSRQNDFLVRFAPDWVGTNGSLDTNKLFELFTGFWRENSEIWGSTIAGYEEAAPHLVFQAYLQRVANGQGQVFREYGLGKKRTDLMLRWRDDFKNEQRVVIELKVMRTKDSYEKLKAEALKQTAEYAKRMSSTENHILVFDRDEKTDWREKVFTETAEFDGMSFKIWGV